MTSEDQVIQAAQDLKKEIAKNIPIQKEDTTLSQLENLADVFTQVTQDK